MSHLWLPELLFCPVTLRFSFSKGDKEAESVFLYISELNLKGPFFFTIKKKLRGQKTPDKKLKSH